jgi:neutral trehalase
MTICPPGVYWIYPVGWSPYGWLVSFVSKKVNEKLVSSHVPTMGFSAETAG